MSNGLLMRPALRSASNSQFIKSIIGGQILQPQDRVTASLDISLDLVADAGVHVIGTSQHENARFLILRTPRQDVRDPASESVR